MIAEMKKVKRSPQDDLLKIGVFFGLGLVAGLIVLFGAARITWHTKFYPGVSIAEIEVDGLTRDQAKEKVYSATENYQANFNFNGSQWAAPKQLVEFEIESSINEAYQYGRRAKLSDYLLLAVSKKTNFPLKMTEGKTDKLELLINNFASAVEIPAIDPSIEVVGKEIKVTNGSDGTTLDTESLHKSIALNYSMLEAQTITIPTKAAKKQLTTDELSLIQNRAERVLDKKLILSLDDERISLDGKKLIGLLSTDGENILDPSKIDEYAQGLTMSLNKAPQDAKFEFENGKVVEFAAGKDGVEVDLVPTIAGMQQAIIKLLESDNVTENVEIAVTRTPPKITTDKVNELGIRERIGRGESYYAHSIPNRIYNVGLAAERANSALIAPGEEFSFNKVVGEISGATGYRAAYVISGGRTILGDGGGVCQVSTTLFRGAMNAGLPILERWAHAYRVGYYEQNSGPGIDATVYAPSKDLRFLNDTPGHILVQTINDPKTLHLVVEIYGTSDGRVATVTKPKVWGNTPPLPTIYQDDPTLATGTLRQVDWAAPGAKASFEYKVTRNDEMIQEITFTSSYRPWASVYLRGTGL